MVTIAIIIINILVFLKTSSDDDAIVKYGSSYYQTIENGHYSRLITSAFIHNGIVHLAVNMYTLYNTGTIVERYVGSIRYLVIYFVIMIVGQYCSTILKTKNKYTTSIGASGVIFGIIGMYCMIRLKIYGITAISGMVSQIFALIIISMLPGIDALGHALGFIIGCLIGYII